MMMPSSFQTPQNSKPSSVFAQYDPNQQMSANHQNLFSSPLVYRQHQQQFSSLQTPSPVPVRYQVQDP